MATPVSCEYTGNSGILFGIDLEVEEMAGMGYLVTVGLGVAAQAGLVGVGNDIVRKAFG